jgi:hypothetical protein
MGWFNVLKGAYPSLQQIDKTLNVAAQQSGIVRGSCIYQSSATEFSLATVTQATDEEAYIYFCLVAQDDLVAGMAGSKGQGAPNGVAKITGLAVGMPMEFETSEFITDTYHVGQLLSVANGGKLTAHGSGDNVVAQVTKTVATRWVNDAIAVTGFRTGANMAILTARTLWLPCYTCRQE